MTLKKTKNKKNLISGCLCHDLGNVTAVGKSNGSYGPVIWKCSCTVPQTEDVYLLFLAYFSYGKDQCCGLKKKFLFVFALDLSVVCQVHAVGFSSKKVQTVLHSLHVSHS